MCLLLLFCFLLSFLHYSLISSLPIEFGLFLELCLLLRRRKKSESKKLLRYIVSTFSKKLKQTHRIGLRSLGRLNSALKILAFFLLLTCIGDRAEIWIC